MAILHRKEEKIQVVLGRLPKKYTHEQFVEMFIKLYSKDWGKIKSAYIKQSQDKEPGTVVNMPKPELYLKQILQTYLSSAVVDTVKAEPLQAEEPPLIKVKAAPKKKEVTVDEAPTKKEKTAAKKVDETEKTPEFVKNAKAAPKKKVAEKTAPIKEVKKQAATKTKVDADDVLPVKEKKAKASKK